MKGWGRGLLLILLCVFKSEALKSEEAIQEITREEIKRNRLIALGILIAAAAGIFIYIKYTAYIGYYLALFAIPMEPMDYFHDLSDLFF